MPNVYINKDNFLAMLDQFTQDIPYEVRLIHKIMSNLPPQALECVVEELYFKYLYKGTVYRVVHTTFKDDIHMFTTIESLKTFLKGRNMSIRDDFWDTIDSTLINKLIKKGTPLCGYLIYKEVIE